MTLLEKSLSKDAFEGMRKDPVRFVEAFDGREVWDFQADILRQATERDTEGKFVKPICVVSMPRQNTKSTLSGWLASWRLFTDDGIEEIVVVANDRAQATIILRDVRRLIQRSGLLFNCIDESWGLTKSEIRLKDGKRLIVKSSDSVSSRGLRPGELHFDELGWAADRGLFDTLQAGMAASSNPLTVITSTVGPARRGILWELFELGEAGDPAIRLIYHTENLSPKISQEFLDRQKTLLPTWIYNREHGNQWSESGESFITEADWKRSTEDGDPRRIDDPGPTFGYLDLGWAHDESVLAISKIGDDSRVSILAMETWRGSPSDPVQLSSVEERIRELVPKFHTQKLVIESPQGLSSQQTLAVEGLPVELAYPTAPHQRAVWGALQVMMQQGQIRLPPDKLLRAQLLSLVVVTTATGWRIDADSRLHQDRALSCAGAAWLAQSEAAIGEPMFRWSDALPEVEEKVSNDSGIFEFDVQETTEQAQARLLQEAIDFDFD